MAVFKSVAQTGIKKHSFGLHFTECGKSNTVCWDACSLRCLFFKRHRIGFTTRTSWAICHQSTQMYPVSARSAQRAAVEWWNYKKYRSNYFFYLGTSLVDRTLGSTSFRYGSDTSASDRCFIDVDPGTFAIWARDRHKMRQSDRQWKLQYQNTIEFFFVNHHQNTLTRDIRWLARCCEFKVSYIFVLLYAKSCNADRVITRPGCVIHQQNIQTIFTNTVPILHLR